MNEFIRTLTNEEIDGLVSLILRNEAWGEMSWQEVRMAIEAVPVQEKVARIMPPQTMSSWVRAVEDLLAKPTPTPVDTKRVLVLSYLIDFRTGTLTHALEPQLAAMLQSSAARALAISLGRALFLEEALAVWDRAVSASLLGNDDVVLANTLIDRGLAFNCLGPPTKALADFDSALKIIQPIAQYGPTELRSSLASVLGNRGNTLQLLGRFDEALADFNLALPLIELLIEEGYSDDLLEKAKLLMNRGNTQDSLGQLFEALADFGSSLTIFEQLIEQDRADCQPHLARVLLNRSATLHTLNRHGEALLDLNRCLMHYQELIDVWHCRFEEEIITALTNRGATFSRLGRYDEALVDLNRCRSILLTLVSQTRLNIPRVSAKVEINHGVVLDELGRHKDALGGYSNGIRICQDLADQGRSDVAPDLALALMNRAGCFVVLGDYSSAVADYDSSLTIYQSLVEQGRLDLLSNLATLFLNRAVVPIKLGRSDVAVQDYRHALEAASAANEAGDTIAWRIRLAFAQFCLAQGHVYDAEQVLEPALEVLERISNRIPGADDRTLLRANTIDVYRLLTYLALHRSDRDAAFDLTQRAKGRLLAEMQELSLDRDDDRPPLDRRLAELDLQETWLLAHAADKELDQPPESGPSQERADPNETLRRIRDERASLRTELEQSDPARALLTTGAVRKLDTIAEAVEPDEALVDFLDLDAYGIGVTVLVGRTRELVWSGFVANDDVERALSLLDKSILLRDDIDRAEDALALCGRFLIEPCLPYLQGVARLLISPSDRLHRVPFEAVRVRQDNQQPSYLVDLFEVGRVPTATSLSIEREAQQKHFRASWPPALVAAAPFSPNDPAALALAVEAKRELRSDAIAPLLPGTGREVLGIAGRIHAAAGNEIPAVCLLGPNATRAATVPLLPAARFVHLATHGARGLSGAHGVTVQDFFLLFAPTDDVQNDTLAMRELFDARLPLTDVFQVVLAACHLGSVVMHGEEAMGFVQAFLSAGAGVVFAPLWAVDDTASCDLMLAYHDELLSELHPTVGQAWRTAIRRLREKPEYEHPYFWAAWLPSGDIGLRLQPN